MTSSTLKILFLHGLDSSKESTKFEAIDAKNKYCINVDYRNLNFQTVATFYQDIIDKIKPEILVGHSLGGYWALKMLQHCCKFLPLLPIQACIHNFVTITLQLMSMI